MSSVFRTQDDLERFERNLRDGARAYRRDPLHGLRARVLAEVRAHRATEGPGPRGAPGSSARSARRLLWLAAAAVLLAIGAWAWSLGRAAQPATRQASIVSLSRELLDAGTRVLDLPAEAEGNLRVEAKNLLLDASRAAEGVVRGLPLPLRASLERM